MSAADREQTGTKSVPKAEISETPESVKGEVSSGDSEQIISREVHHVSQIQWNAPLPPPDDFNAYSESAQDLILSEFKKESEHRRAVNDRDTDAQIAQNKKAQNMSFTVLVLVILVSAGLVWLGHPYGLLLALAGIIPAMDSLLEKLKELTASGKKENRNEHSD